MRVQARKIDVNFKLQRRMNVAKSGYAIMFETAKGNFQLKV